jgi:hypothetical protein
MDLRPGGRRLVRIPGRPGLCCTFLKVIDGQSIHLKRFFKIVYVY